MASTDFIMRVGLPSATKSYTLAKEAYHTLLRNVEWYESGRTPNKRKISINNKFRKDIAEKYSDYIDYFEDSFSFHEFVINARDRDIFIDEISSYFDADQYMSMPREYTIFLNQYAKRGNTIQCTTQDASQVWTRARRKITTLYHHINVFSNPRPSPTRPKIKHIYGLYIVYTSRFVMSPDGKLDLERISAIPQFGVLQRKYVELYDTRQEIPRITEVILSHIDTVCEHYHDENHTCDYKKAIHK